MDSLFVRKVGSDHWRYFRNWTRNGIAFAKQGANVVIAGRREAEGAESIRLIEKAGGKGLFLRTDVSIEKEIETMVARTLDRFGRLDFAFNNAGTTTEMKAGGLAHSS